jgi:hypothetical protein
MKKALIILNIVFFSAIIYNQATMNLNSLHFAVSSEYELNTFDQHEDNCINDEFSINYNTSFPKLFKEPFLKELIPNTISKSVSFVWQPPE